MELTRNFSKKGQLMVKRGQLFLGPLKNYRFKLELAAVPWYRNRGKASHGIFQDVCRESKPARDYFEAPRGRSLLGSRKRFARLFYPPLFVVPLLKLSLRGGETKKFLFHGAAVRNV